VFDPVSGFTYPQEWILASNPADHEGIAAGFLVLTSSGMVLRRGYTTGATMAAAAYAAVCSIKMEMSSAPILLPCGIMATIQAEGKNGVGFAEKDSGDYPHDITAKARCIAEAKPHSHIDIIAGEGIGIFVRDTPRYKMGDPAISPASRGCILSAIACACKEIGIVGAQVRLSVKDGAELAKKTLNPKVGVEAGISIVGTTGFVEPWDDHLTSSMADQIASAMHPVITTGRQGLRFSKLLYPEYDVILAGSKLHEALSSVSDDKIAILCGLPGLILRFLRLDVATREGFSTVEELVASPKGAYVVQQELLCAKERYPNIHITIVQRDGTILAESGKNI
jgi:cobalt-precorrin-5B (C1)-methyltransferase